MATRGFLIRFIDIGLIVLFGFLMISEIDLSSRVELAGAGGEEVARPVEPVGRVLLSVAITPEGRFVVSEQVLAVDEAGAEEPITPEPADAPEPSADAPVGEASAPVLLEGVSALTSELRSRARRHADEGLEAVVLIEPSLDSVVQSTVDVMDACDRLGLNKSLRMDIEVEARAPEPGGEP